MEQTQEQKIEEVKQPVQNGWLGEMNNKAELAQKEAQRYGKFDDGEVKELTFIYDPYEKWKTSVNKFGKETLEMPCKEGEIDRIWSVALSNPIVTMILAQVTVGNLKLKIKRTGVQSETKYSIEV